jgi:hypothetical protein
MRVTKITVSYQRVFNLGNYESLRLEETVEAELDDTNVEIPEAEYVELVRSALWQQVKASVRAQAMPVVKARQEQVAAIAAGLPAGVVE